MLSKFKMRVRDAHHRLGALRPSLSHNVPTSLPGRIARSYVRGAARNVLLDSFECKTKTQISSDTADACITGMNRTSAPDIKDPPKAEADLASMQPSVLSVGNRETGSANYATATQLEQMKPYPGVDYLGVGYDIFHGNPSGDGIYMLDPGFRQPVRILAYSMNWLTRDGKFKTPKGSVSLPLFACTRSDQYSNVADASSYADSLAVDASLDVKGSYMGFGAAFKVSYHPPTDSG